MVRRSVFAVALPLAIISVPAHGQGAASPLEGMWSDPSNDPIDSLCRSWCTQGSIDRLNALLDDPANDDRSYSELRNEANEVRDQYVRSRLTQAAIESEIDPLEDPGYLECEPWGLARQLYAPHQLEIRHHADRIEMRYGEWGARRTIYLDADALPADTPPSLYGYSIGRYQGDRLVIETYGISSNLFLGLFTHSDQLTITESYARDGDRLLLTVTFEDPLSLKEPVEWKKVSAFAPDIEIAPYVDCERPETSGVNTR